MSNHTVPATAGGMPNLFPSLIDPAALSALDLGELRVLTDALMTAADVLCGLSCQPRFYRGPHVYNGAGEQVDNLIDFVNAGVDALRTEAKARQPTDRREAEERAWLILQLESHDMDVLANFAASAATFSAEAAALPANRKREA